MKKVISIIILFILLFSLSTNVNATEAETTPENTEENVVLQPISTDEKITVKAKVVSAGKAYEKEEAEGIVRTLQDVTIQIKEGKYKGQKVDAVYVMTYDVENKIIGYELSKGNTVIVQLTEEGDSIKST